VLESISDAYYAVDRDWTVVLFNGSAEDFFDRPRSEILGRNLWDIYGLGRETEFGQLLVRAMELRQPGRITARSALRDGRTVDVRVSPLGEEGVGVSLDDVSERADALRALQRSQQRLDLAVGAHKIGIFDWHVPSGTIVWSKEEEEVFGLEPGTFKGTIEAWGEQVLPDDLIRMQAEMAAAMASRQELYAFEFRIRRPDGAVRWIEGSARFLYAPDGKPHRMVGTNMDVTERKVADEHQRLLLNELNHRVKNTLAIVQSIAQQSMRGVEAAAPIRDAFEGRLAALAAAHDVLTQRNWEAASIAHIVATATGAHHASDGRFTMEGPALDLEPKTAVALGLAMHELGTNAVKYGALSRPDGRVEVRWSVEAGRLRLTWRERGGPSVTAPSRRGFGTRLLLQGLAEELGGKVSLDFNPDGLLCTVEADLDR